MPIHEWDNGAIVRRPPVWVGLVISNTYHNGRHGVFFVTLPNVTTVRGECSIYTVYLGGV